MASRGGRSRGREGGREEGPPVHSNRKSLHAAAALKGAFDSAAFPSFPGTSMFKSPTVSERLPSNVAAVVEVTGGGTPLATRPLIFAVK